MSLQITLHVNGLDYSRNEPSDPREGLVNFLEGLEGVLGARYESESRRFVVSYDPNRITLLRILNRIEFVGRETGLAYRPADVQTHLGGSFTHSSPHAARADHLAVAEPADLAFSK